MPLPIYRVVFSTVTISALAPYSSTLVCLISVVSKCLCENLLSKKSAALARLIAVRWMREARCAYLCESISDSEV